MAPGFCYTFYRSLTDLECTLLTSVLFVVWAVNFSNLFLELSHELLRVVCFYNNFYTVFGFILSMNGCLTFTNFLSPINMHAFCLNFDYSTFLSSASISIMPTFNCFLFSSNFYILGTLSFLTVSNFLFDCFWDRYPAYSDRIAFTTWFGCSFFWDGGFLFYFWFPKMLFLVIYWCFYFERLSFWLVRTEKSRTECLLRSL